MTIPLVSACELYALLTLPWDSQRFEKMRSTRELREGEGDRLSALTRIEKEQRVRENYTIEKEKSVHRSEKTNRGR